MEFSESAIAKLQSAFRGGRSRKLHGERAKDKKNLICPFYASSDKVVLEMMKIASIAPGDLVVDLGCGDGSILMNLSCWTKAHCLGFDIDPILCNTARRRCKECGVSGRVDIVVSDIVHVNLSSATVICLFLVPSCLGVVSDMIRRDCAKGTRIVCYKFPLPQENGWTPLRTVVTEDVVNTIGGRDAEVFFYVV